MNAPASMWVAQGSSDWIKARIGHLTASDMGAAMAYSKPKSALHSFTADGELVERLGNGITAEKKAAAARKKGLIVKPMVYEESDELEPRRKLKMEIVAERLTGLASERFVTNAMKDGIEREPYARGLFEAVTGNIVRPVGFIPHKTIEWLGASPDGEISRSEGFEAKCPTTRTFMEWLQAGIVPPEYEPQMCLQCLCAGYDRVHFVAYHPDMPERLRLFYRVYEPSAEYREKVEAEAVKLLREVDLMFEAITATEPT